MIPPGAGRPWRQAFAVLNVAASRFLLVLAIGVAEIVVTWLLNRALILFPAPSFPETPVVVEFIVMLFDVALLGLVMARALFDILQAPRDIQ